MKAIRLFFTVFFASVFAAFGQENREQLDTVLIKKSKLQTFSVGQQVQEISDSTFVKSQPQLTNLLHFNSSIYFKENGFGMVSSPSFRGTTAQHTAVIWNGININSQTTGQTDFNTLSIASFDQVNIKAGGGSNLYGTSAIGGTIHLENHLAFNQEDQHQIYASYGSFNSYDVRYKNHISQENWSLNIGVNRNQSNNDYELPNGKNNLNGAFYHNSLTANAAIRLQKHVFRLYNLLTDSERHFSLIRPTETKTKYQDFNTRSLLEWEWKNKQWVSNFNVGYLLENYQYFENIETGNYTFGKVKTWLTNYDFQYKLNKGILLNPVVKFRNDRAEGSNLEENERDSFIALLVGKHQVNKKLSYEASFRKEWTSLYESPLLYALGTEIKPTDFYLLSAHFSKSYRIPTFNDLFWEQSGNLDLKPETSYQYELGNRFYIKQDYISVTGFYNDIKDMIRWLPANQGIWRPQNIDEIYTYGVEISLQKHIEMAKHQWQLKADYAYTISKNKAEETFLIYVPEHKLVFGLNYEFKNWEISWQSLHTSEVYTRTDNDARYNLDAYWVSNFALSYTFGKNKTYEIGTRVNNIFEKEYQVVELRYMPLRNYNFYFNLNI
ncbi:TonB-dependent siderophore receptor [Mesonia sp. K7]|uniref:TonB-dependent receptor plug domain-containing protein n=1 Tax=Mesonia sp. K7 TaxID=2218606 RepID=UPI000DA756E6|nr:TonB-dependent receptor [Mesonia sp. K7]PZD77881.1 TonB-dependent receptor [Mesonia sp. K7]